MEADYLPQEGEPEAQAPEPPPIVEPLGAQATETEPLPPPPVVVPRVLPPPPGTVPRLLAGLESGILGSVVMIGWFALDSLMERQYWWAILNLWGAGVYHNRVFSMGFGMATVAGAATHFFLHGLGGALWGLIGGRMRNFWAHLACSFAAAGVWYFFLMNAFWPMVAPVVSRVTPTPATALAYFLFGAAISRNAHRARQLSGAWET